MEHIKKKGRKTGPYFGYGGPLRKKKHKDAAEHGG